MAHNRRSLDDAHHSDASYLTEDDEDDEDDDGDDCDDVFDKDDAVCSDDAETEATDIEDLLADGRDGHVDVDIEDQIQLFGGNVHPPEYYRQAVQEFNDSAFDTQDYSDGSLLLIQACEEQWIRFCKVLGRDPQECLESLPETESLSLLYNFFDWSLNQKVGKDGRKKRGTTKSSSLGTYWKVFRLVFERATGGKLDSKMNRRMHQVLRDLAKKHGLSDQKRMNRCMTVEDLKEQIETTISTTKKSFKLGELRILCVLFLLLLAPAGARPTSILRLRFGDIRLVLVRDPEGGPHNVLIRFLLAFTKTYLGVKDAKTYSIPETLFDDSLLLNTHVFLLGVLFRHRAFQATSLTSPEQLTSLDIHSEERELPLPLRDDLKETYVFRRTFQTLTGYDIAPNDPITYSMITQWIKRIGEILGLEYPTIPYSLRYNAANEFDRSGDVSEALRNLALDHANSNPFQRNYLGREVCADTWAVIRRQKPQQALVRQACSIGHSISKRRPTDLTSEQAASVNTDPLIKRLERSLRDKRQGSQGYMEARRRLKNAKQTLKRALKQKIREDWTAEQAVNDIERQLHGVGFAEEAAGSSAYLPQRPAQRRLVEALTAHSQNTLEAQYRRRNDAINAVAAYCTVEEGLAVRRNKTSFGQSRQSVTNEPATESPLHVAIKSVLIKSENERPRRCFLCVGKALSLVQEDSAIRDLTREFYSSGDLTKHFRRKHLSKLDRGDKSDCNICEITLEHKMHLQVHAKRVHGTVS